MPIYSAPIMIGATGNGFAVPPSGTGWRCSSQTPPVKTVTESLLLNDNVKAITISLPGPNTLIWRPNWREIVLDGAAPITLSSAPAGFSIQSMKIVADVSQFFSQNGGSAKIYQNDVLIATYTTTGSWPVDTVVFTDVDISLYNISRVFFRDIKIVLAYTGGDPVADFAVQIDQLSIEGDYQLWSTQITLTEEPDGTILIEDGANQLDEIVEVKYIDLNGSEHIPDIISQTPAELSLSPSPYINQYGVYGVTASETIYFGSVGSEVGVGDGGIEFTGAPSIIRNVDTSGIYFLNHNKTNDTLYLRETDAGAVATDVVKIPDPKIVTGYPGG